MENQFLANLLRNEKEFLKIEDNLFSNLKETSGAAYDNKARLYEKLVSKVWYNKLVWGTMPSDYMDFAKKAIIGSKGTCIDVGCGGLTQTVDYYAVAENQIFLIDNSLEMLKIAKERLLNKTEEQKENIQFVQADAFHLPFGNETFDNLFSFGMLHLFDNKKDYIKESIRVLKSGHPFYFTSLTGDRKFSRKYINLLQKNNEFGEALSSSQTIELFTEFATEIDHYCIGTMVFITGIKR